MSRTRSKVYRNARWMADVQREYRIVWKRQGLARRAKKYATRAGRVKLTKCGTAIPEKQLLYTADGYFRYCGRCARSFSDGHRLLRWENRGTGRRERFGERGNQLDRVAVTAPSRQVN